MNYLFSTFSVQKAMIFDKCHENVRTILSISVLIHTAISYGVLLQGVCRP